MKKRIISAIMAAFIAIAQMNTVLAEEALTESLSFEACADVLDAGEDIGKDLILEEMDLVERVNEAATENTEQDEFLLDVEEVETRYYDTSILETVLEDIVIEKLDGAGMASEAGPASVSPFRNRVYTDSYGAQLSDESKVIYDAMVAAYVDSRTAGQPTIDLNEMELLCFSVEHYKDAAELAADENLKMALENLKFIMQPAYNAFVYDYPEAAWLRTMNYSPSVEYIKNENGEIEAEDGSCQAKIISVKLIPIECYAGAGKEIAAFDNAVNAAVEEISAGFSEDTLLESKIKAIHDFLCDKIVYTDLGSDTDKSDHSAAGVFLKNGKVVCEGYAKAFKVLCRRLGIESVLIPGYANGAHMWNYVKMEDGNWYLVDVTWDDGTIVDYDYFLKGSNTVSRIVYTNFSNSQYTQNFVLPYLSSQDYSSGIHLHSWELVTEKAATCTAYGSRTYSCSDAACGASVTEQIGKDAHKWRMLEAVSNGDATCMKDGTKTITCDVCKGRGKVADAGSKIPHQMEYVSNNDATCTQDGTKTEMCVYGCGTTGETVTDVGSKGHKFINYVYNNDATCQGSGTKTAKCENCDALDTVEDVEHTGEHDWEEEKTVDREASCTEAGSKSIHCKVCKTILEGTEEKVEIKKHSFINYLYNNDATCQGGGTKTAKCSNCSAVDTVKDPVSIGNHIWKTEKTVDVKPTCTKAGSKSTHCSLCDAVRSGSSETVKQLPHTFENSGYVYNKDATVFKDGTKTAFCKAGCGTGDTVAAIGTKLVPTYKITAESVRLKAGQSTTKIKVTNLAKGDSIESWTSSDKKIVTVSESGKIKGIKKGTAYITVKLASKKTIRIKVTVQSSAVKAEKISGLSKTITIKKGKKADLNPVLSPVTCVQNITYTTSNKKTATVNKNGVITARAAGKARITVKAGTKKFVVTVTVPQTKTTKIQNVPEQLSLALKKTYQLKAKLIPANSDQKITYSTSKKSVAAVSNTGKITAKRKGTAVITVKSGGINVKCRVTVK